MVIKLLDNSIINKIAAGEVIERPASVVKELLENSFDSGADEIKIEIYEAGIKKIKISDNGSGMTKEDALISYKRHTTSKINNEEDLFSINSLGFRGEALASIAEISNLKIITKTFDSSLGTFIEVEGGKLIKEEQIGCSNGTIIEVNDLYFNKRYVKNNIISQAIYEAYKTLLFINRHPVFILEILIDPKEIDVNVHPAKTEIRIKKEELISGIIFNSIKNAFQNSNLNVSASLENETNHKPIKKYEFAKDKQSVLMVKDSLKKDISFIENNEKKSGAIKKQNLLMPRIIELTPIQYRASLNNKTFFESLGFNFDDFENNSIKLTTIPEIFGRLKSTLLLDVINEIVNLNGKIVDKEIEERIIRFACRASVKAGEELTSVEMRQLIENLGKTDNPYSCPHGRPTLISFSIADLEKKFKRTGW